MRALHPLYLKHVKKNLGYTPQGAIQDITNWMWFDPHGQSAVNHRQLLANFRHGYLRIQRNHT